FGFTACSGFSKVQKSKDYEYKLKMADQYYEQKKYNFAQQLYEELFPIYKGTDRFEELYYKYAFCTYDLRDYLSAENLFKSFVEVFPNSKHSEEMDYMRAYTYYKQSPKVELDQTNTTKTMGFMQTFINTHPGSAKNKEASEIIDKCRVKMELKEQKSAELYFNLSLFKAAAISYTSLINNFPDSEKGDEYKLQVIKAYFEYATLSVEEKKEERFEQVITEYHDFLDRYPESKLLKEAEKYFTLSQTNIKNLKNEPIKETT
ncbi:MAG: outer membrane protein assembly factor BamD, partial [Bacteroidota bacterium]